MATITTSNGGIYCKHTMTTEFDDYNKHLITAMLVDEIIDDLKSIPHYEVAGKNKMVRLEDLNNLINRLEEMK